MPAPGRSRAPVASVASAGHRQHPQVGRRRGGDRQRRRHQRGHAAARRRSASPTPMRAAAGRQHQALGEHLAGDAARPRAHRHAHRQLALPLHRPGQEQAGQVGARDEQHAQPRRRPGRAASGATAATPRRAARSRSRRCARWPRERPAPGRRRSRSARPRAWAMVTPGGEPADALQVDVAAVFQVAAARTTAAATWRCRAAGSRSPRGITPTTTCGVPLSDIVVPRMSGRPPNTDRQTPSLSTTGRRAAARSRRPPRTCGPGPPSPAASRTGWWST